MIGSLFMQASGPQGHPNGGHRSMIIIADTSDRQHLGPGVTGDVVLNWAAMTESSTGVMYAVHNTASSAHDAQVWSTPVLPASTSPGHEQTVTITTTVHEQLQSVCKARRVGQTPRPPLGSRGAGPGHSAC